MSVLWFEFLLALRRLVRRRVQNGLMLVTFTVSVALALLSWSLFHNVFLSRPDFDPRGEYFVMTYASGKAGVMKHATVAEMAAIKDGQKVFADFAEVGLYSSVFIRTPDGAERSLTAYLSSRALQLTGAKPLLGRLFTSEEDKYRSAPAALLSQRMWENSYGGDPGIVGKTVEVTGDPFTIVGVLPKDYKFPNDQDLWLSLGATGDGNQQKWPVRDALVKLKPGVTRDRAERDLQVILNGLGPETPANKNELRPVLQSFRDVYLQPDIKVSALILFGLSLIFVMVSCANAANLMLIDFLGRRSEVAAALALGIPRSAAIRGVCWQVAVMAAAAALLSIALLPVAGPLLYRGIRIVNGPYWLRYDFAWHDVGMAFALAGVSAAVTLIAPIVYLLWVDPDRVIREHAYASRGTGRALWRRSLLTGQIALLTVLGVSSGLLVRSSYHVGEAHWGYDASRVFIGKISALAIDYGKGSWSQGRLATHLSVLEQVRQRPETVAAAVAEDAPGYSRPPNCAYALDPAAFGNKAELGEACSTRVGGDFFATLDVPFVTGEMFPEKLPDEAPDYVVINESLARKLWPGQDPLQRTLYVRSRDPWMKQDESPRKVIVHGVVRDFQASGPTAKTNDLIFAPYRAKGGTGSSIFLFVRDRAGLPAFRSLNDAVHRAEPRESLYFPSTIAAQIDTMLSSVRLTAHLTTLFAAAAVLLCAIGVYSLTVAQVLQSSREFGIRMALGAEPRQLWTGFTRVHLLTALVGVGLGLVGASQVVRVLSSLLYGVDPRSVATYAGVALAILAVAALACVPSLFRLKRINPAECLRSL
jgi:predicted permease